jgi:hypothetical protein
MPRVITLHDGMSIADVIRLGREHRAPWGWVRAVVRGKAKRSRGRSSCRNWNLATHGSPIG